MIYWQTKYLTSLRKCYYFNKLCPNKNSLNFDIHRSLLTCFDFLKAYDHFIMFNYIIIYK